MPEIYSIGIADHDRFARDRKAIEAFRRDFHIPAQGERAIAVQTTILDFIPKFSAVVLLLETHQRKSWILWGIPRHFFDQRTLSPYVAPSLGTSEKLKADVGKIYAFLRQKTGWTPENQKELTGPDKMLVEQGKVIIALVEKGVIQTNELVTFIRNNLLRFIQA